MFNIIFLQCIFSGKIRYYTVPPEESTENVHISSEIVTEVAKEFDLENFESMETDILKEISKNNNNVKNTLIESLGPVKMDEDLGTEPGDEQLV